MYRCESDEVLRRRSIGVRHMTDAEQKRVIFIFFWLLLWVSRCETETPRHAGGDAHASTLMKPSGMKRRDSSQQRGQTMSDDSGCRGSVPRGENVSRANWQ